MIAPALALCAAMAAPAAPANASAELVAVSLSIAAGDAVQRDIAAAVVRAAGKHWALLAHPLDDTACKAGDTACLRAFAAGVGARYLLVVGVAPLGVRDHVLAVQLFETSRAKPLFEESAVQSGVDATSAQVTAVAARLVSAPGAPPPKPAAPIAVAPRAVGAGTWSYVGAGLIGVGALAAAATGTAAGVLLSRHQPGDAGTVSAVGIGTSAAVIVAGTVAFLLDD